MPELHNLVNEWREEGYIKLVKWHTVNDEYVCDICKSRSKKEFPLDDIESLMPGCDNCRCWITPIVDLGLINTLRKNDWEGVEFDN